MRVLVITTVHDPRDSRIFARQLRSMLEAGWQVTYAASFHDHATPPPTAPELATVDVPRAHGRHRVAAWRAVRTVLRDHGSAHDVVLLHDPELLLALPGLRLPAVVWDVHEDTAAAIAHKPWLPVPLRRPVVSGVSWLERWAERRVHLLLAETSYQERFGRPHLVVPNTVRVPAEVRPPGDDTVVYVGSLSRVRGAAELVQVGRLLHERTAGDVRLHVIGPADDAAERLLVPAHEAGWLQWAGRLPADEAMAALDGALAGLSLLHDVPNYRRSMPTKVAEYLAHGVPAVTTPLPLAVDLVEQAGAGVVVPFGDAVAAVDAVLRLREDRDLRNRVGAAGHAYAATHLDWTVKAEEFLSELQRVAR